MHTLINSKKNFSIILQAANNFKSMIKFISISSRRSVKDFIMSICRKLNFTRINHQTIGAIFLENLPNSRYHLHIYERENQLKEGLKKSSVPSTDNNFHTLNLNGANHLYILPPFNRSTYRVKPLTQDDELFEKVIEFKTGIQQTLIDVMLTINTNIYKIQYIVCTREKTFIAFFNGTDAAEVINNLKQQNINAVLSSHFAYIEYIDEIQHIEANDVQEVLQSSERQNPRFQTERHESSETARQPSIQFEDISHRQTQYHPNSHQSSDRRVFYTQRNRGRQNRMNRRSNIMRNQHNQRFRNFNYNNFHNNYSENNDRTIQIQIPNYVNPNDYIINIVPK